MTTTEAIEQLNRLWGDSEEAHVKADKLLLAVLRSTGHSDVADAWENARKRIDFWYA